jgi:hypothetical protein
MFFGLTANDVRSMRDRATYYLDNGVKSEVRLARDVFKALAHIEVDSALCVLADECGNQEMGRKAFEHAFCCTPEESVEMYLDLDIVAAGHRVGEFARNLLAEMEQWATSDDTTALRWAGSGAEASAPEALRQMREAQR